LVCTLISQWATSKVLYGAWMLNCIFAFAKPRSPRHIAVIHHMQDQDLTWNHPFCSLFWQGIYAHRLAEKRCPKEHILEGLLQFLIG
jgi:hypothetical protein